MRKLSCILLKMQHVIKLTNMDKTFEESCEGGGGVEGVEGEVNN
jgi:hypothetical protein